MREQTLERSLNTAQTGKTFSQSSGLKGHQRTHTGGDKINYFKHQFSLLKSFTDPSELFTAMFEIRTLFIPGAIMCFLCPELVHILICVHIYTDE